MIADKQQAFATAIDYHQRTKHHTYRYATGPETLDWTEQPNPFREFAGSARFMLPLSANNFATSFAQLYATAGTVTAQPFNIETLGALLELSFGIAAWKEYGPDRWALRCNPSSGNLHPTEAYVLSRDVIDLPDGVYHYVSRDHVLEQRHSRMRLANTTEQARVWLALSSIHWREAWKYGERAFRYCQLDIGHALGALRYAAAVLGWRVRVANHCNATTLATQLGLDRAADFANAEQEDPDVLLEILPCTNLAATTSDVSVTRAGTWRGQANVIDPHPMYRWPIIDRVSVATTRDTIINESETLVAYPTNAYHCDEAATTIIRRRRSAQQYDGQHVMSAAHFFQLLDRTLPRASVPWDVWDFAPRIHLLIFVHRVEGVAPGLYALPRRPAATALLQSALRPEFEWQPVIATPAQLPLFRLLAGDFSKSARTLSCQQNIAGHCCFTLAMLAEFDNIVQGDPWRYRQLHWEAGLLGQVLYLEAETMQLRGTGIGCFFDDAVHEFIGLRDKQLQTLYHFAVGRPLVDERITTLPPYPQRTQE